MKAIVYTSENGSTERYSRVLSERTGLPAYALQDAIKVLPKGESILYLGWVMAGQIQGLKKAMEMYRTEAVCAVGLGMNMEEEALRKSGGMKEEMPVFPLMGDLEPEKLKGLHKLLISFMGKSLSKKQNLTEEEKRQREIFLHGAHAFDPKSLAPVLDWYNLK